MNLVFCPGVSGKSALLRSLRVQSLCTSFDPTVGTNVTEPFPLAAEQTVVILFKRARLSLVISTKQNRNVRGRRSARGRLGCLEMTIQSTAF